MHIKNALVYQDDHTFVKKDIYIEDELFTDSSKDGLEIDGAGLYAIPGLIDLHFHGCVGHDFCDGTLEALHTIASYQASVGVTSICPASMTLSEEELVSIMKNAAAYAASPQKGGADFVGINLEGPFISAAKKGAQSADHIRPCDASLYEKLQSSSGNLIKLVDLAPETDGALDFITQYHDQVRISLAHTTADYETASEAFSLGAKHVTHLFNAMPPFTHRAPGVIGAAVDAPDCMAELICDGVHIHPSAVRSAFQLFGRDRIILISDSMRATGLEDGLYTLGGQDVKVEGSSATLVSDGALAGSVTHLMDCLRTAVTKMQIPLEDAVGCATINPAKALGISDQYGSIASGKIANLVLLDENLEIKKIIIHGEEI